MRITRVDNLRGLGIVLIVLGHCFFPDDSIIVKFIFTFHVGLFFFLSGFLFNEEKHKKLRLFVKGKFYRLIIPFIIFNIIMFSFYKIKELLGGSIFFVNLDSFIKGILYGSYIPLHKEIILTNVPTWFLVSLFMVSIYYFLLYRIVRNRSYRVVILVIISILVFIESKYISFRFPFSMEISFMAMLFYGVGHSFKNEISMLVNKIDFKHVTLLIPLIVFNILTLNNTIFSTNSYGTNYGYFLLTGFSGITFTVIIAKLIKKNFLLDFLGKNSILILGFERIKFIVLSVVISLSFDYLQFEKSHLIGFIQTISTILFLMPIIFIINKFMNLMDIKK